MCISVLGCYLRDIDELMERGDFFSGYNKYVWGVITLQAAGKNRMQHAIHYLVPMNFHLVLRPLNWLTTNNNNNNPATTSNWPNNNNNNHRWLDRCGSGEICGQCDERIRHVDFYYHLCSDIVHLVARCERYVLCWYLFSHTPIIV